MLLDVSDMLLGVNSMLGMLIDVNGMSLDIDSMLSDGTMARGSLAWSHETTLPTSLSYRSYLLHLLTSPFLSFSLSHQGERRTTPSI
jgi:hypothetical protein